MWHRTDQRRKKGTFACVSKPRPRNSRNSGTNSDSWFGSCAWSSGRPSRTTRSLAGLLSPQASYSPKCLEGKFYEVELPLYGVLRSSQTKHSKKYGQGHLSHGRLQPLLSVHFRS